MLAEYVDLIDGLISPDLVIIGGGVSKDADRFIHELPSRVRCVPAALKNRAGIVGAAMLAAEATQLTEPSVSAGSASGPGRAGAPARAGARRPTATSPIEHHGIIGDLHTRRARRQRGHDRLVLPRALRRPEPLRGDPRRARTAAASRSSRRRAVHDQAALPARHRRARDALLHARAASARSSTSCRSASTAARSCAGRGRARVADVPHRAASPRSTTRASPHRLDRRGALATFVAADQACELRSADGTLGGRGRWRTREFTLARGERASFVLAVGNPGRTWDEARSRSSSPTPSTAGATWIGQSRYRGRWREMSCDRSAITLKLLHLRADRRGGGGPHRRACRSTSAGRATGTTATAGCATRPSRCSRSCGWASTTRPSATCTGCTSAATSTRTARRCRSSTRSTAAAS